MIHIYMVLHVSICILVEVRKIILITLVPICISKFTSKRRMFISTRSQFIFAGKTILATLRFSNRMLIWTVEFSTQRSYFTRDLRMYISAVFTVRTMRKTTKVSYDNVQTCILRLGDNKDNHPLYNLENICTKHFHMDYISNHVSHSQVFSFFSFQKQLKIE